MEKKQKILDLRGRLDITLSLPDLVNEESIKLRVKNQLLRSSPSGVEGDIEPVLERRTIEVSNFLEMLRSASGNEKETSKAHRASHNDWKIKQDTDQLRVMYREGPNGSPFHTILTEGYADGPIDVCLCVSWESTLYGKWWPQYNFPTFKIIMSECLQKVRIGEDISLVRVKVPWPVTDREAVLHYFEIEYFEEDLILVLLKTISDTEYVDVSSHGFSTDGIPKSKDIVRVDMVGGFVLQKVSANKSYFRAIANIDIKMDFVPPSLINFITRQLIGNGHKLYQKAVGSVATTDEDYRQALEGLMYVRIRKGLDSSNKSTTDLAGLDEEKPTALLPEKRTAETAVENLPPRNSTFVTEIMEEEAENSPHLELDRLKNDSTGLIIDQQHVTKERLHVSPEVEHALNILDNAIAILRSRRNPFNNQIEHLSASQEFLASETVTETGSTSDGDAPLVGSDMDKLSNGFEVKSPAKDIRHGSMGSASLPEERPAVLGKTEAVNLGSSNDDSVEVVLAMTRSVVLEGSLEDNHFHGNGYSNGKPKRSWKNKKWACCVSPSFIRG